MLKNIALTLVFSFALSDPVFTGFHSEINYVENLNFFIKNYKNKSVNQTNKFRGMLRSSKNCEQIANIALTGKIFFGELVTKEEIDNLWLLAINLSKNKLGNRSENNFSKIFGIYMISRFFGNKVLEKYENATKNDSIINNEKLDDKSFKEYLTRIKLKIFGNEIKNKVSQNDNAITNNQYDEFIKDTLDSHISDVSDTRQIRDLPHMPKFYISLKNFENAVGGEYVSDWLKTYVFESNLGNKRKLERKLLSVEPEILVMVAQNALCSNPSESFPLVIAGYTLAATKNKKFRDILNKLLLTLIDNKQTKAFEPLLLK